MYLIPQSGSREGASCYIIWWGRLEDLKFQQRRYVNEKWLLYSWWMIFDSVSISQMSPLASRSRSSSLCLYVLCSSSFLHERGFDVLPFWFLLLSVCLPLQSIQSHFVLILPFYRVLRIIDNWAAPLLLSLSPSLCLQPRNSLSLLRTRRRRPRRRRRVSRSARHATLNI